MKHFFLFVTAALVFSTLCNAQIYNGKYFNFFDYQQPDARSEAMGKVQTTLTGNPLTSAYNAASTSFSCGLNADFSHVKPRSTAIEENGNTSYNNYGASYNSGQYGAIAFGYRNFSVNGMKVILGAPYTSSALLIITDVYFSNYNLNYSYRIMKNLSMGITYNYIKMDNYSYKANVYYFDLGVMEKIPFESESNSQNIIIGASLTNFTNNQLKPTYKFIQYYSINNSYYPLPSELKLGTAYTYETKLRINDHKLFRIMAAAEYRDMVNSSTFSTAKLGTELTFAEMLNIRFGYYYEDFKTLDYTPDIKKKLSEFTYGLGINLPLNKLLHFNMPVTLQVDYANLKAPVFSNRPGEDLSKRYSPINFNLNMIL